jgi:hypothetical protein
MPWQLNMQTTVARITDRRPCQRTTKTEAQIVNPYFHVYKTGKLTVVGFEAKHLSEPQCQAACRDQLLRLTGSHACKTLVVDLMDVSVVSSWVIGVLAAVKKYGLGPKSKAVTDS